MGIQFIRFGLAIHLALFASSVRCEEKPRPEEIDYTIQSGENRELLWSLKFPDGEKRDLTESEKSRIFREVIFPRVSAEAEAGEEPAVWMVGYFHLDGQGTEKNLAKAEAAFREGMARDNPLGMIMFGEYFYELGISARSKPAEQRKHFDRTEEIFREVIAEGHPGVVPFAISLAKAHLFGWYGLEPDPKRADSILQALETVVPDEPSIQFWRAKVFISEKQYPEAFEYAEKAESGYRSIPEPTEKTREEIKLARAVKISAAVLGGEISKIDPEEFLEASKESLGLTGKGAWAIPVIVVVVFCILLWRTRRAWRAGDGEGPGLRLSIMWISAAILAAGIGFNISLPGLVNGLGNWIGAVIVTVFCLAALWMGGWSRYFGKAPLFRGAKPIFIGLGIVVVGIVGMQLIAMGYGKLYELVLGRPLDQQLVSLFLKSENLLQLAGTVLVVGLAIPFYEEVFFRGFLFDAVERRWSSKTALVASSVLFALVHGLTFALPLLFLSFALGWLRMRNGNLRMSVVLHAANNSFSVLVGYFWGG